MVVDTSLPEMETFVKMTAYYEYDGSSTRFHACRNCGFTRVPYWNDERAAPEQIYIATARFCPGCGHPVIWTRPPEEM